MRVTGFPPLLRAMPPQLVVGGEEDVGERAAIEVLRGLVGLVERPGVIDLEKSLAILHARDVAPALGRR